MHIPKSGGTSVDRLFSDQYGTDKVLIHNKFHPGPYLASENPNLIAPLGMAILRNEVRTFLQTLPGGAEFAKRFQKKSSEIQYVKDIPTDLMAISGHMEISVFEKYKNLYPYAKTVVVLRDPVDLAWSLYKWLFTREEANIAPEGYRKGMLFDEFLALDSMKRYQAGYIPYRGLSDFDIVLTTENLSTNGLIAFNFARECAFPFINKGPIDEIPISREDAISLLGDTPDFYLFNQAKELELKYIREGKYTSAEFQTGMAS